MGENFPVCGIGIVFLLHQTPVNHLQQIEISVLGTGKCEPPRAEQKGNRFNGVLLLIVLSGNALGHHHSQLAFFEKFEGIDNVLGLLIHGMDPDFIGESSEKDQVKILAQAPDGLAVELENGFPMAAFGFEKLGPGKSYTKLTKADCRSVATGGIRSYKPGQPQRFEGFKGSGVGLERDSRTRYRGG